MAVTLDKASATKTNPARPASRPHPHLYQIHTWAWLDAQSHTAGETVMLGDVPDTEWDRIRDLGFDLVYLLGIWQRSPAGRRIFRTDAASFPTFDHALPGWTVESVIGSPFSIVEYVPDSRIGTWADVDAVRAKLHARGMRLILDFVPNHTGPDHPWIIEHPDYFMQVTERDFRYDPSAYLLVEPEGKKPYFVARGRDPYFAPWADTAQIDYFNEGARAALIDLLKTVGSHCDGLRCDMAMLILNDVFAKTWHHLLVERPTPDVEFWSGAIAALPADFVWMAEVYWDMEARLQALGFDFTYDKRLYDRLKAGNIADIRSHLTADAAYQGRMARFLENHDEARSLPTFGRNRIPVLAALIATLPGLRFFHQGQFTGKEIHLPMPLNRAIDEPPDMVLEQIYETILGIAKDPAFHSGDWALLPVDEVDGTSGNLLAYRWRGEDGYRVIILNLDAAPAQGRVRIAHDLVGSSRYNFADILNQQIYLRDRDDFGANGLYVRLDGYHAHIFAVSAHD
ncbi:MAG: putative glycosyl hydrolase [Rhodospirillales bacterium]|nr:putative glycosyl hydrolase [Rhodospirillales bacterium]